MTLVHVGLVHEGDLGVALRFPTIVRLADLVDDLLVSLEINTALIVLLLGRYEFRLPSCSIDICGEASPRIPVTSAKS